MALQSSGAISASDINTELGRSSNSLYSFKMGEGGTYATINQISADKPDSAPPFSLQEWYGYDHSASASDYFLDTMGIASTTQLRARYDTSVFASYSGSGTGMTDISGNGGVGTVSGSPSFTNNASNNALPSFFTTTGTEFIRITNSHRWHAYLTVGFMGGGGLGSRRYAGYNRMIFWVYVPSGRTGYIYKDENTELYVNSSGRLIYKQTTGFIFGTGNSYSVYPGSTNSLYTNFVTCPTDQWIMVSTAFTNYTYRYRSGRSTRTRNYPAWILRVFKSDGTVLQDSEAGFASTGHTVPANHTPSRGDLMTNGIDFISGRVGSMFVICPEDGRYYTNSGRTTSGSGHSASYCDGGGDTKLYNDTKAKYGH